VVLQHLNSTYSCEDLVNSCRRNFEDQSTRAKQEFREQEPRINAPCNCKSVLYRKINRTQTYSATSACKSCKTSSCLSQPPQLVQARQFMVRTFGMAIETGDAWRKTFRYVRGLRLDTAPETASASTCLFLSNSTPGIHLTTFCKFKSRDLPDMEGTGDRYAFFASADFPSLIYVI
jgi:hypothetical protein